MSEVGGGLGGVPTENRTLEAMKEVASEKAVRQEARMDTMAERMSDKLQETVHPLQAKQKDRKKGLKDNKKRVQQAKQSVDKQGDEKSKQEQRNTAAKFEQRNPELKQKSLMLLRDNVKPDDDADAIMGKVKAFFKDVSNQDEALEFLEETTWGDLKEQVKGAREEHNATNGREVAAGRNIGTQAREFAKQGLGSPNALRDMYRDITGNPRSSQQLFKEMSGRFNFGELKKVARFLFHSLGSDMRSQGPSIDPAQLQRLMTETRSLQAILGVYRFFHGRMKLMEKQFKKFGLKMPGKMNFESMSKEFMALAGDRYPTGQKVKERAVKLGIQDWIQAKIIAFSQFRDAVRQMALNQIFETVKHRDEVFEALLEALEEWEDELEELLEYEEEAGEEAYYAETEEEEAAEAAALKAAEEAEEEDDDEDWDDDDDDEDEDWDDDDEYDEYEEDEEDEDK